MMDDIRAEFPSGVTDLTYNDTFGDVFGDIYAFTADGLTQRQLRDYVEHVRREVLTIPNVGKVDLIGAQDEVIYLEFSVRKMAALGISEGRAGADRSARRWPIYFRGESAGDQSARE